VEVDRVNEVLLVRKASRRVLHPLDLRNDRFAGRVTWIIGCNRDSLGIGKLSALRRPRQKDKVAMPYAGVDRPVPATGVLGDQFP
jgi:hypothetical protein